MFSVKKSKSNSNVMCRINFKAKMIFYWEKNNVFQAADMKVRADICYLHRNSIPPTTTLSNFQEKLREATGRCFVDVAFWGGVIPGNQVPPKQL